MNKFKYLTISIILVLALTLTSLSFNVSARPLTAPAHVNLGNAEAFAVLAGAGITNTGATTITGDVGSSPTHTETGFAGLVTILPPGVNHNSADPNDAFTVQAKTDLTTAYNNAAAQLPKSTIAGGIIGTSTLVPGIYNSGSSIQLNGPLTLDGGGNPNAIFVFQAGSTLTTASASEVVLTNGAQACNVYWQVGSSATLGTTSTFIGTIMADQAITDNGGSIVNGRFLARVAAVTLNHTTITRPLCAPVVTKSFSPASIPAGLLGDSTLTITFNNINTTDSTLTSDFTDTLPSGVVIGGGVATTCGGTGTLTAVPGTSSVTLGAGAIIPGGGTCTLTVHVATSSVGCFINTIPIGALVTSAGSNITAASATICGTNAALNSPTIATILSSNSITLGGIVHDSAILTGATATAGGTVTYTIYTNNTCTLNPRAAGTVTVTNHLVPDSNPITFNSFGTYYWQAVYSGDANNNGATSDCLTEEMMVNTPTPTRTPTNTATATATNQPIIIPTNTPIPPILPGTGFAPQRVTVLSAQPADKAYADLGDLWLEIPRLGVQTSIVGVPQSSDGTWDVSWLGQDAGWLNGSAFPTWSGNSVLTGHVWNADNTAGPFLYINTLWWGDKIIVHAWGAQYVYEVRSVQQVSPANTAAMMKHETLPWVTLVTCRNYDEASNSYKYRVLVRAVLVEVK